MTPATDAAIKRLLCECFPPDVEAFTRSRYWHGTGPTYTLIQRDGGDVVGHVGVVRRTVRCGGRPVEIAGIQSLCVVPRMRVTGLSWALMREAMAEARRRGIKFGLLFCVPRLERFYGSLKWVRTDAPMTMDDERGEPVAIPTKNIAMYIQLTGEPFPDGPVHLGGRDW